MRRPIPAEDIEMHAIIRQTCLENAVSQDCPCLTTGRVVRNVETKVSESTGHERGGVTVAILPPRCCIGGDALLGEDVDGADARL